MTFSSLARSTIAVVSIFVAACNSGPDNSEGACFSCPTLVVGATPADGTSNYGQNSVVLSLSGVSLTDAQIAAFAGSARLQTFPDGGAVDAVVTTGTATLATVIGPTSTITFSPHAPLASGWYEVVLPANPAPTYRGLITPFIARFRPDTAPSLVSIGFCKKADGVLSGAITLSESIKGLAAIDDAMVVHDLTTGEACPTIGHGTETGTNAAVQCKAGDIGDTFALEVKDPAIPPLALIEKDAIGVVPATFQLHDAIDAGGSGCAYYWPTKE